MSKRLAANCFRVCGQINNQNILKGFIMNRRFSTSLLLFIALTCLSSVAIAGDVPTLKIVSNPGKPVCQSNSVKIGDVPLNVDLCVLGGSFSHDQYSLKIDKKQVLNGIDDETTRGINATYSGENLTLTCVPQHQVPKGISPEEIEDYQKMMNISAEDAKQMAILSGTVEIGRLCKATLGTISLIEAQVVFE